ncbi:DUF882 domain-containing protein [Aurantimonas sp. MSK8Z-1]|uniref:DUF882 domain-containing protein n=1 Tax=Mangrovibrevibacter kandeliae TaxID=2968473 RepID=UPI002118613D|nr:DUF882 domain-containing protein [Aurantimonas sp. MSK8Z-1]MCW4116220.1 DUF882 domain-containing protein [Aurantimonas sp. MSK8Z-1]
MFGLTDLVGRAIGRVATIAACAAVLALAGTAARAETRTLKFYHLHTHEKAEIAYKKDGRYLPDGLKKINWILRDWRESQPVNMDPRLLDLVWEAYRQSGSSSYIQVICGYRAPETNSMLRSRTNGVAKKSQHMLGRALDFTLPDVPLKKLREIGLKMQVGGVGYYPTSGSPFVHFDVGNVRHWPRMSRRELVAVFPNGGTLHVPSDGKPLPGYQQALASYKQRKTSTSIEVANAGSAGSSSSGGGSGGKTLLAALFGGGGGEDEAEDDVEAATPEPRPQPAARAPQPKAPAPEVEVAAAVSPPAPVPAVSVRAAALPSGVAMPDRFDSGPSKRPVPAAEIPFEVRTEVAAIVPLPSRAPSRPSVPAAAPGAASDDVAALVASLETAEPEAKPAGPQLAFAVPTPLARPRFERILDAAANPPAPAADPLLVATSMPAPTAPAALHTAAIPAAVPAAPGPTIERSIVEEVAALVPPQGDGQAGGTPDAAPGVAARAAATGTRVASLQPAAAPAPGRLEAVPAGKTGRLTRKSAEMRPRSRRIEAQDAIRSRIEVATLVTSPEIRAEAEPLVTPKADMLMRDVPTSVYAAGFTAGPRRSASRIFGETIKFLPVAKFE